MPTRSTVFDLGRQLLRCGADALLDSSLQQLSDRLQAEDAAAAEVLRDLLATGLAETLRDALEDDRLDRWVAETCTQSEEEVLCRRMMRWLGTGKHGDDDPARLVQLAAFPELSADGAAQLQAWAAAHGVADLLDARALERLPGRSELSPELSIAACCLGRATQRSASLLAAATIAEEARAYLQQQAAQLAAAAARATLWSRPLSHAATRQLAQRLRALLPAESALAALAGVRFMPARPVRVDVRTGSCEGMLLADDGSPLRVQLHLSGFEQRALASRCARCSEARCVHVQALAARLLDALHAPHDRLHASLCELSDKPSWQRFVAALQRDEDAEPAAGAGALQPGQLAFRVRLEERAISVGVLLQKPVRNGGVSAGKLIAPLRAARMRACSELDRPVLDALALTARSFAAQYTRADLASLRALAEHPRVSLGDGDQALRLAEQALHVELLEQPEGLLPRVSLAGSSVVAAEHSLRAGYLFRHDARLQTLWFAPLTPPLRRLLTALEHFHGLLPPESFAALSSWLAEVRQVARVSVPAGLQGEEVPALRRLLLRITPGLDEGIEVALSSRPLPLGALWPPGQGPSLVHGLLDGRQICTRRDLDWERLAGMQMLEALGAHEHPRLQPFIYRVETQQAALHMLARAAELTETLDLEWSEAAGRLTLAPALRAETLSIRVWKRSRHWLTVEGSARNPAGQVALERLLEAARRGERFVRIADGSYAQITQELFERLERAQLCFGELKPGGTLALPTAAVAYWQAALGERSEAANPATRAWLASAAAHDPSQLPQLSKRWQATLRDYQATGARWLLQMSNWAPGACLADEMGLGKTVQAISLLDARAQLGPALVVAPTSVVANWATELARFAAELTVVSYQGTGRERRLEELRAGHVVLCSYELLLRDAALFAPLQFATQILDEAHLIKNARTARAKAAFAIHADFRVALSGTPIENRLGDLWSLLHGIAPGLLGDWARFRALFAVPIERYGDSARAAALRSLIAPFVLRRTKDDVASELPERTEVVHRFALSEPERALYQAAEREIRSALDKRTLHETRSVQILAELTRLRLLACHPRLVVQEADVASSKLTVLLRLLDDILPRGHRALLFSQFTRHLALVRDALDARGLGYLYLDGSTPAGQRGALVARFQAGEAPLFLISLKAGGVGLNLTAADYVVHLDPWWNPAAEDQASDRAHRLGQLRPVTVIKLVAEDTIEEKVVALHGHKRELAESIIHGTDTPAQLDLEALRSLLP
jgi:superfamily II DNA or RNA helicase